MEPMFVFLGCRRVVCYESKLVAKNVGKNKIYCLPQILSLEVNAESKRHGTMYHLTVGKFHVYFVLQTPKSSPVRRIFVLHLWLEVKELIPLRNNNDDTCNRL